MARRKMDPEKRSFIKGLLEHYQPKDAQDVQNMLKDLLGETLQDMLESSPKLCVNSYRQDIAYV